MFWQFLAFLTPEANLRISWTTKLLYETMRQICSLSALVNDDIAMLLLHPPALSQRRWLSNQATGALKSVRPLLLQQRAITMTFLTVTYMTVLSSIQDLVCPISAKGPELYR